MGNSRQFRFLRKQWVRDSGVASAISEGDIFMYSCSAQLISFEIESTSKEINCTEHEYMNISPSLIALATLLVREVSGIIHLQPSTFNLACAISRIKKSCIISF